MGVNILSRRFTIMGACKMWYNLIGNQCKSSNSKTLIYWTDSARQIIIIILIKIPRKTFRNSKAVTHPSSNPQVTQQNLIRSSTLMRSKSWVLVWQLTKALIRWWIISRQTYLRNCSLIRTFYHRYKESFQLWRVMAVTKQICSQSQILISPKTRITLSTLSQ